MGMASVNGLLSLSLSQDISSLVAHLYHVCVLLTRGYQSALGLEQADMKQVASFSFSLPFTSVSTAGSVCSAPQLTWHLVCAMGQYNTGPFQEHLWDILAPLTNQPDRIIEGCDHNRQYHLPKESCWT